MIDIDVRAIQIRRLDAIQLEELHRREAGRGYRFLPWEIARGAKMHDIRSAYGVPKKAAAAAAWDKTVRQVMGRFLRERRIRVDLGDLVDLHAFDREVHGSDLDFNFHTATPAKRADDWFERSGVDQ